MRRRASPLARYARSLANASPRPYARRVTDWSGEIDVARSWALFAGAGGVTRRHAHLAHKLVVGLGSAVDVEGGSEVLANVWFVASRAQHRVLATGEVALAFVDVGSVGPVDPNADRDALLAAARALRETAGAARTAALVALVGALPVLSDARVARAAKLLRDEPQSELPALAERVGLSLTRLTHLFTSTLGVSPRQYRTWGALRRALRAMAEGKSLTDAAHAAGFSDSAHLSRSFVAMLGVVPGAIARGSTLRLHEA